MGKYEHMSAKEINLAKRWQREGKAPHAIAGLLKRDPKTIREHLQVKKKINKRKVGRPAMPEADFLKCVKALERLQKKAKGTTEVTAAMVKEAARVQWGEKCIREAFAQQGKSFRRLREKPILTEDDIIERDEFADEHKGKAATYWINKPHAKIDNKKYPLYLDHKARSYASRRSVRGAYRSGGQALETHLVKPKATLKFPCQGVMITGGVIAGRIRFWHITRGRWNATKAAEMYRLLEKALKKAFPNHRGRWVILEDNDPAGYKSGLAKDTKAELKMDVMSLPPRSPDLNVLDYSLWAEVSKRMRAQEKLFAANKKESAAEFEKRLRATALGVPRSVVEKALMDMRKRLVKIKKAKGGLIEG